VRQVFLAQLLPLGLGMAPHFASAGAVWLGTQAAPLGNVLLVSLIVLALVEVWQTSWTRESA
jgi:hypothetical protein